MAATSTVTISTITSAVAISPVTSAVAVSPVAITSVMTISIFLSFLPGFSRRVVAPTPTAMMMMMMVIVLVLVIGFLILSCRDDNGSSNQEG